MKVTITETQEQVELLHQGFDIVIIQHIHEKLKNFDKLNSKQYSKYFEKLNFALSK